MSIFVIGLVCAVTLSLAVFGLHLTRTTGEFYVASRRVSPTLNASAIAGEYLSAASFLGVVGVIFSLGVQGLWLPVGYTAGLMMVLLFVAAPLRRSGAYTLPDFMVLRFRSVIVRRVTAVMVVIIGCFYIVPQLHGAALVTEFATEFPGWVGAALVIGMVLVVVISGGMRSVTIAQAVQYWIKLAALLIPAVFIALRLAVPGETRVQLPTAVLSDLGESDPWVTASLILALILGAVGLPHVLVRFYTNPDGQTARRTTVMLILLLAGFYLITVFLGIVARQVLEPQSSTPDIAVLQLPGAVLDGLVADVLTAVLVGGAFAAFLSATAGLVVSVAGVVSQEVFGGSVSGIRIGAVVAVVIPVLLTAGTTHLALAGAVALVFTFAASTVAPVILLGIWWPRITALGAVAGLLTGASATGAALLAGMIYNDIPELLRYPGLWTVPLAFFVIVVVSLTTRPPRHTAAILTRLHSPDSPEQHDLLGRQDS